MIEALKFFLRGRHVVTPTDLVALQEAGIISPKEARGLFLAGIPQPMLDAAGFSPSRVPASHPQEEV